MATQVEDFSETIEKVRRFARTAVNDARFKHSVRTAEMARQLCVQYGLDGSRGYLAGIAHDICKDMDEPMLAKLAASDGKPVSALEKKKPSLLHGRAAAVKLRVDFGVNDGDVLQAVACHTFGGPGICDLAQILYVSDKIEPGRPYVTEEYLRKKLALSLHDLVLSVVGENVEYLQKKGKTVAPDTFAFYESLRAGR